MPPRSQYKFTRPQHEYLKGHLELYMVALQAEDTVKEITSTINTVYDALVKEFRLGDQDKEAIQMSLTMWFNYKAQRTLKKMQIEATLRISGCDIFRRERWVTSIRPVLVRVLGHEDSTKPEWVGTYKRVVSTLWNLLSESERSQYDKMAEEENKGHASRENKIAYADKYFKKRLRKFITELANLCEARILVFTLRDSGIGKKKWVSVMEDDSGPKFMADQHADDLNSVDWYGGDWVDWHEGLSDPGQVEDRVPTTAKNVHDYKLIVGPSGEMELPDPSRHPSGYNWSSALSQFIQIAWGRAHGSKVPKKPKYTAFGKDPAKYLDLEEYLPDPSSLAEDFKWVKPCSMSPEQLLAWARHLYNRQQRRKNGEDIEVLAFYPVAHGKGKATVPAASSVEEYIQNLPHMLARHEESGRSGEGRGQHPYVPGAETTTTGERAPALSENILFERDSPGAVLGLWKDRMSFLRKLCKDANYGRLLGWLDKFQTRSMLAIPDGWRTRLSWATWSYPNRWLPANVYEDDLAVLAITSFVKHWHHNIETFCKSPGYIEHLLLTIGMISRDIYSYQFSSQDPEELDETPLYCNSDRLNLSYHDELMRLVGAVFEHAESYTTDIHVTSGTATSAATEKTPGPNTPGTVSKKPNTKRKRLGNTVTDPTDTTDTSIPAAVTKPKPRPRKRVRIAVGGTPEECVPGGAIGQGGIGGEPSGIERAGRSSKDATGSGVQMTGAGPPSKPSAAASHSSRSTDVVSAARPTLPGRGRVSADIQRHGTPTITGTETSQRQALTKNHATLKTNADLTVTTNSKTAGRKSGRLREKGPTTYTARGEVFRGGQRVNEHKYDNVYGN